MGKTGTIALVWLLSLIVPAKVAAGGFEGPGVGTRALSMGGAFIGLADDWSASFWNPAGLAFQKGMGVGQSVDLLESRSVDANGMANPIPPFTRQNIEQNDPFFQLGGEPTRFGDTNTKLHAALPSVANYKVWERWAIGLGIFTPLGFAFKIDDRSVPGIAASFQSRGYIVAYNLSVAHKLTPRWSLGAGVNYLDARVNRDATKETATYTFTSTSDGRGHGVQGVFGVRGLLSDHWSVGAVYKTGSDITMHGASTIKDSRFPLVTGSGTLQDETSGIKSTIRNPAIYGVGLAFFPSSRLTFTADWQGTDWRPMRVDFRFDNQGTFMQDQNFNAGWRFTNRARCGGEYKRAYAPRREWAAQWGYSWDPSAIPDSGVSVTNILDISRHFVSGGFSWRFGSWQPGIGFSYAQGSRNASGVDYKTVARLITVSLAYRMGE